MDGGGGTYHLATSLDLVNLLLRCIDIEDLRRLVCLLCPEGDSCHAWFGSCSTNLRSKEMVDWIENIVLAVKTPSPKLPTIQPFEADEIRKLLRQTGQGETAELRLRDRTLILFLLDTGVRVFELISLRVRNADLRLGTALVQGKGRLDSGQGKQRMVYFADRVKRSLQRYLSERGEHERGDWLFVNKHGRQLERGALGRHIRRFGRTHGRVAL